MDINPGLSDKKSILQLINRHISFQPNFCYHKIYDMSLRTIKSLREKEIDGTGGQRVSFETH